MSAISPKALVVSIALMLLAVACSGATSEDTTAATTVPTSGATSEDTTAATTVPTASPDVVVPPADERFARRVDCLRLAGLEPTVDEKALSYTLTFPEEQREAVNEITKQCEIEAFGFDPAVTPIPPPTNEALSELYDALVETEACLIYHGANVPDRGSKESFIESGGTSWHPFNIGVPGIDLTWDEWERLNVVCPRPHR